MTVSSNDAPRTYATNRLAFARKQHPELGHALTEARADLAAAIIALDDAEDEQADYAAERRIYSQDPVHMREDLAAALRASLSEDQLAATDVEAIVARLEDHPTYRPTSQSLLRELLDEVGPVVLGGVLLFSLEAETSIMGDAECIIRWIQKHPEVTVADLRWPADVCLYESDASPDTPAERERIARIRRAIKEYQQSLPPLRNTVAEQQAVEMATHAHTRALADLVRGHADSSITDHG